MVVNFPATPAEQVRNFLPFMLEYHSGRVACVCSTIVGAAFVEELLRNWAIGKGRNVHNSATMCSMAVD